MLVPRLAVADFSRSDAGTSAGQFLTLGTSARGAAMGDAYTAVSDDAATVRNNPAAMLRVEGHSASFTHLAGLEGTYLEHLGYVRRHNPLSALGASMAYMGYGSIPQTDISGASLGSASPYDMALSLAYARQLQGMGYLLNEGSVGISLSFIQSKIVDSANTVTATLGYLSGPLGTKDGRVAFVAENIGGGSLKYDQTSDPLPVTFKLGGALKPIEDLTTSAELALPRFSGPYLALGAEKRIATGSDASVFLRGGLNTNTIGTLGAISALSFGFGVALQSFSVDYGLTPFGDLGWSHRLTLSARFGGGRTYGGVEYGRPQPVTSDGYLPPKPRRPRSVSTTVDYPDQGRPDPGARRAGVPQSTLGPPAAELTPQPPPSRPAPDFERPEFAAPEPRASVPRASNRQDHMDLAGRFELSNDWDNAAREYRLAASAEPTRPEPHLELARLFMVQQNWNAAAVEWLTASKLLPRDDARRVQVNERLAASAVRLKDMERAKTYYLDAVSFAKSHGITDQSTMNAYLGLAYTLGELGQTSDAIRNYEKVKMMADSSETREQIDQRIRQLKAR
ncbi:MAG: tetratricopeptide repeat protein [Proteobacteria bacterium]|nr:tetratricopeptide repeat protein [Pseudomonadota bacterium]